MSNIGNFYICATPIGNLADMTFRAVSTLKGVDLIAAEDTRVSKKLLDAYDICTPLISYHEHNKATVGAKLIARLLNGENIALITDAGMPAISDPGADLVSLCHEQGIAVTAIPGASACVTALALSGIGDGRFVFEGFLPVKGAALTKRLGMLINETRAIVIYVAPHRVLKTLNTLEKTLGNRAICICRELTKKFEQTLTLDITAAISHFEQNEPRGEFVFVIEGKKEITKAESIDGLSGSDLISMSAYFEVLVNKGIEKKAAIDIIAKERGMRKNDVYKAVRVKGRDGDKDA